MRKPIVKILVVGHKNFPTIKDEIYIPIQAGRKIAKEKLPKPWIGDDTGKNISEKNKEYCELTAMYWAWKNYKKLGNPDYIGLCHYRRYFYTEGYDLKNFLEKIKKFSLWLIASILPQYISKECCFDPTLKINLKDLEKNQKKIKNKILHYTKKYDLIVPLPVFTSKDNLKEQYEKNHVKEDLEIAIKKIIFLFPEYKKILYKVLNKKEIVFTNMFIMKRKIFYDYSKWLFKILFECEKEIKISNYKYQRRVFGFLAERLFNFWLEKNKEKIKIKFIKTCFLKDPI